MSELFPYSPPPAPQRPLWWVVWTVIAAIVAVLFAAAVLGGQPALDPG